MDNLNTIKETLPNEAAEQALAVAFRASALSLTELFKSGKRSSKRAYHAGKKEALQDVLEFVQASLDGQLHSQSGPLNVAKLIDYICARQETLKAEEEAMNEEEAADRAPAPHQPPSRPAATRARTPSASSTTGTQTSRRPRQATVASNLRHRADTAPPSSSSPPAPTASTSTTPHAMAAGAASLGSPLTRLQAKKDRSGRRSNKTASPAPVDLHHQQQQTPQTQAPTPTGTASNNGSIEGDDTAPSATDTRPNANANANAEHVSLGLKRRWSAATLHRPHDHLMPMSNTGPHESQSQSAATGYQGHGGSADNDDGQQMLMMEIDQVDPRPYKRVARR